MKKLLFFLGIGVFIIFAGCKNNSTEPANAKEIWPLKVGNNWVLKSHGYDSLGNVTDTINTTFTVISDTTIKGIQLYVIKEVINSNSNNIYYCNLSDGFYQYLTYKDSLSLILKYPVSIGETFLSGIDTFQIKSTNEQISVPAGNFSCCHYENTGNSINKTIYYCTPGVGIIKIEAYAKNSQNNFSLILKTELISYKIN